MSPEDYHELVKRHNFIKRAKYLTQVLTADNTQNRIRKVAFKQESGYYPEEYLKKFDKKEYRIKPSRFNG